MVWLQLLLLLILHHHHHHIRLQHDHHHHQHQEQEQGEPVDGLLQLLLLVLDPPLHQLEVSLTVTLKIV